MFKSLVLRITLIFCASMSLFTAVFIVANQFAIYAMRRQVIEAQAALLTLYTDQLDNSLDALRMDMAQFMYADDLAVITLNLYPPQEDSYLLNVQSCRKWLQHKVNKTDISDTHFIYTGRSDALLSSSKAQSSLRHRYLSDNLPDVLDKATDVVRPQWSCMLTSGYINDRGAPSWVLYKVAKASDSVYMGTLVSIQNLIDPLQGVGEYEGLITLIYDDDGTLLAPEQPPEGIDDLPRLMGGAETLDRLENAVSGENYVVIGSNLATAPLRIYTLIPEAEVLKPLAAFRFFGTSLPFILLAMTLLTLYLIRRSLNRPLQNLIRAMNEVSTGNLAVRLPAGVTEEFIKLNDQFNNMVTRIGDLNKDVAEQTHRAHRAEVRHLQAQINPHFYQNTLNLIYNLAVLGENDLIKRAALYLADYFRFIMRSGDSMIALRDELSHINNYMELQRIRYPNAIEYQVDVPEELLERKLLPLLIQPFVENCVIHGLTTQRLFRVCVSIRSGERGMLIVNIQDNGNGISDEMIERLNGIEEGAADGREKHIGVLNVVTRLRRYHGDGSSVCFGHNQSGPGTFVHIVIPATIGEEVDM